MGYRSDVKYMIMFPNETLAKEFIAVYSIDEVTNRALEELKYVSAEGQFPCRFPFLLGEFNYVSWYRDSPEVASHTTLMAVAAELEYGTAFARIGEDTDDTEEEYNMGEHEAFEGHGDMYGHMGVSRSIYVDADTSCAVPSKALLTKGETK